MGSVLSKIYEEEADSQWEINKKWLKNESKRIEDINPFSSEFDDLKWLRKNEEKY